MSIGTFIVFSSLFYFDYGLFIFIFNSLIRFLFLFNVSSKLDALGRFFASFCKHKSMKSHSYLLYFELRGDIFPL